MFGFEDYAVHAYKCDKAKYRYEDVFSCCLFHFKYSFRSLIICVKQSYHVTFFGDFRSFLIASLTASSLANKEGSILIFLSGMISSSFMPIPYDLMRWIDVIIALKEKLAKGLH